MNSLVKISDNKSLNIKYLGFLAKYVNHYTQYIVNHNIKKFVEFLSCHNISLDRVDQSVVNIYVDGLRKKGLSNNTVNQNISCLAQFLKFIGKPELNFKRSRVTPYESSKLVSMEGLNNVLDFLRAKKDHVGHKQWIYLRDYLLFSLMFLTGLRKNEVLSLQHKDVILENDKYVYTTKIKGGSVVTKLFPEQLVGDFLKLKQMENKTDKDFIFTSNYKGKHRVHNVSLNSIFNKHYQNANQTDQKVTVHSIRALSGYKLFEQTKDILKVKQHMNHKNLNTTDIYLQKLMEKEIATYKDLGKCLNTKEDQNNG